MSELRTDHGLLVGKYRFEGNEFVFEYKHRKGMALIRLQVPPDTEKPEVFFEYKN